MLLVNYSYLTPVSTILQLHHVEYPEKTNYKSLAYYYIYVVSSTPRHVRE
jgi:hypothetical protein